MALTTASVMSQKRDVERDVRVMVVDDSAVVRGLVSRWVNEEPGLVSVARYSNGKLAVDGVAETAPDVIILDIEMPVMDGLTALPLILKACPTAKVIMASTLTRRNAEISFKALSLGATDYIPKPESNSGVTTSAEFRQHLLEKIKVVGRRLIATSARRAARSAPNSHSTVAPNSHATNAGQQQAAGAAQNADQIQLRPFSLVRPRILTIGSSTGGPQALMSLFPQISPALDTIPVLITQHMPPTFTTILAEHLGRVTSRVSKEGAEGDIVKPGVIYVAPGTHHMTVREKDGNVVIHLDDGERVNFCKPAVDPLFQSVSNIYGNATLAVVLTGMGQDGAAGGKVIADKGGSVIAQDEASSVVWGMPGATAAAGACSAVLPLNSIGPKITALLRGVGR